MVRSTEKLEINQRLQNEYRNQISHIYNFLEIHYPDYYVVGVRFLTDIDKDDLDQHWNKNDRDLIYKGLNVKFIKAFMAHAKKKKNGKICSNSNIRKYKDAILWGSKQASSPLPPSFYDELEKFLNVFKKETKVASLDRAAHIEDARVRPEAATPSSSASKFAPAGDPAVILG